MCDSLWLSRLDFRKETKVSQPQSITQKGVHARPLSIWAASIARTPFRAIPWLSQKGRFRKRAVLANVPSFRFLVPGNIRMYLPSFFWHLTNIRMYPRSCFWYREHSPNHTFGNHPFANAETFPYQKRTECGFGEYCFKKPSSVSFFGPHRVPGKRSQ